MAWPELATQDVRQGRHGHARVFFHPAGIEFRQIGRKQEIESSGFEFGAIFFQCARITLVVFATTELDRIDEDADDCPIGELARSFRMWNNMQALAPNATTPTILAQNRLAPPTLRRRG